MKYLIAKVFNAKTKVFNAKTKVFEAKAKVFKSKVQVLEAKDLCSRTHQNTFRLNVDTAALLHFFWTLLIGTFIHRRQ